MKREDGKGNRICKKNEESTERDRNSIEKAQEEIK